MAVPKKKTSRARRDMRRSHDRIIFTEAIEYCPHCGEPKRRHNLCAACGTYRDRQIVPAVVAAE